MAWNYEELAATLKAQMMSHPPIVVIEEDEEKCMFHGGAVFQVESR